MHIKLSTGNCRGLMDMWGASKLPCPGSCTTAMHSIARMLTLFLCDLMFNDSVWLSDFGLLYKDIFCPIVCRLKFQLS